eukprot:CAMPEP_0196592344 /NCGR_PEP_ID=MMETSP1081-20130531/72475_1 /TAXON_ID=36882 /ORGANISM="Pyramimonas amylifera, Strain CCMP720" /LENGTH=214 /DNA_ID=CAMNT_0041916003 /DNA_START=58 /DNA_END=699 /DNA_ORIENTATION=-
MPRFSNPHISFKRRQVYIPYEGFLPASSKYLFNTKAKVFTQEIHFNNIMFLSSSVCYGKTISSAFRFDSFYWMEFNAKARDMEVGVGIDGETSCFNVNGIKQVLRASLARSPADVWCNAAGVENLNCAEWKMVQQLTEGRGALALLVQEGLEWSAELAADEYHRESGANIPLRSYLDQHLGKRLRPGLIERCDEATSPGCLIASVLLGTELDNE